MKIRFKFNTLNKREIVEYDINELVGTDLEKYALDLLKLINEGVISAIYEIPSYGKVEIEII